MASSNPRLALLIAAEDYEHMPELRTPAQDVRLLRNTLERLDFEVVSVESGKERVDAACIRDAAAHLHARIARLPSPLKAEASPCVLFFFAGHGAILGGRSQLLGENANPVSEGSLRSGAVPLDEIIQALDLRLDIPKLLLIDTCQSALRLRGGMPLAHAVGVLPGDMLVDFATQPGEVATDGGAHSPYALALSEHLGDPDSIADVLVSVRARVRHLTGQRQNPLTYLSLGIPLYVAPSARKEVVRKPAAPTDADLNRARDRITLFQSRDKRGRWAWYAILIDEGRQHAFSHAIAQDAPVRLDDYGIVLAAAYGEHLSDELRRYLKSRFGL